MTKIQVYIIHSKLMDVRKQRMEALKASLESVVGDYSFSVEYVQDYDPNTIKQEDIATNVNLNKVNNGEMFDNFVKNMHINQISNVLKHKTAIFKGAVVDADYCLVVEDDVLYGDDVVDKLKAVCDLMKENASNASTANTSESMQLLFLGLPSLLPIDEGKTVTRKTSDFYKVLPCCDSYIASKATMMTLAQKFGPIKFTANIQLSYICATNDIKSHMMTPNVFLDGSKYGAYLSSVDPNSKLIFNPDFNKLATLIAKGKYTPSEETVIENALENIKFKNHPDVMHLEATYLIAQKNFAKAEAILENVYSIVSQNGCIINTETEFLRTHMRIYKEKGKVI